MPALTASTRTNTPSHRRKCKTWELHLFQPGDKFAAYYVVGSDYELSVLAEHTSVWFLLMKKWRFDLRRCSSLITAAVKC